MSLSAGLGRECWGGVANETVVVGAGYLRRTSGKLCLGTEIVEAVGFGAVLMKDDTCWR